MRKTNLIITIGVLLATLFTWSFLWWPAPQSGIHQWGNFIGHLHPLLLHFPIVLVLLLVGFELLSRRKVDPAAEMTHTWPEKTKHALWVLTFLSTFATILAGMFLYRYGEYQGAMIKQHLWGGLGLFSVLSIAIMVKLHFPQLSTAYLITLLVSAMLTIYTSHIGGSITHGADFLTKYLPSLRPLPPTEIEQKPKHELLVYQDLIRPALENKCFSCHNPYKTKGGLLMTSFEELAKGGKSEKPIFVAHQPKQSELYRRITLPQNDDEYMPPGEKPALQRDEIILIKWWIEQGSLPEMMLGMNPPDSIHTLLERLLPNLFQEERLKQRLAQDQASIAMTLKKVGEKVGLSIEPDPYSEGNLFAVGLTMPPNPVNDQTIAQLMPYKEYFSKLSLPGATISDDVLYDVARMPNLTALLLPQTCLDGSGLVYLKALPRLTKLNLSNTFLTNETILNIRHLESLEDLYVFGTDVDPVMIEALQKHLPKLQIRREVGPYY